MLSDILNSRYVIALVSLVTGVLVTVVAQHILGRRGIWTYFVRHDRVGISADDPVFGSVKLTWNDTAVRNLFHSTVELVNQSFKDFEDVMIRAYTNDTVLLTERTEIAGTTHTLKWTDDFSEALRVAPGAQPTEQQFKLHASQRDYLVPIMNRGQTIRLYYLNAALGENSPSIWLDVLHKGIRLRFRPPQQQTLGVPQPRAALLGVVEGLLFAWAVVVATHLVWVAALSCLVFGFVAQVPGALTVRAWRKVRDVIGG